MLKGALALAIRQILLVLSGGLATAGVITATVQHGYYCFDAKIVADATATAIFLLIGGGFSGGLSLGWRILAKRKGGVT